MLTAAVEVHANHPVVIIGSTAWPELDWGDGPAGADERHVAIRTRGQVARTRVSIWSGTMPLVGHLVFDGELDLDDYTICVGDIERLGRWTQRIGQTGVQRVIVRVDDPGNASRVNVGLSISERARVQTLPSHVGPALFDVLTSEREGMALPDARGLTLDGHDSPYARLSAAIMLLSRPDPAKPWLERCETEGIIEWLRWLGVELGRPRAEEIGTDIQRLVRVAHEEEPCVSGIPPHIAGRIARNVLAAIAQEPTTAP
ncbi:hypothetical protein [Micromonospora sp. NPDC049171]|uniref:hypothetical protein n=1 Tax=Micromonospora sp. NPDC049171 TaxID=3155770 RepID=UPI0033F84F18